MDSVLNNVKSKLYLFFLIFLMYLSSTYISHTFPKRLKASPFYWNPKCIDIYNVILIFLQSFFIFLGGILAAFVIRVSRLLVLSIICLITAIILIEITVIKGKNPLILNLEKNETCTFFNQTYAKEVTVFIILFAVYFSFSKFILVVMMLDQMKPKFIGFGLACFVFLEKSSLCCVFNFFPTPKVDISESYISISMPLIILTSFLLIIGNRIRYFEIDSPRLGLGSCFRQGIRNLYLIQENDQNQQIWSSIGKLCTLFIALLPYGISFSQVFSISLYQSPHLAHGKLNEKLGYLTYNINCLLMLVLIPIISIIWYKSILFKKIWSKNLFKIMTSFFLIFLATLSVGIVEDIRKQLTKNNETFIQTIEGKNYTTANMSIFYTIPQLFLFGISEILLITTGGEYMYHQSVESLSYLSIAFFLGAIGQGGVGDFISMLVYYLGYRSFELSEECDKNYEIMAFRLSFLMFVSMILSSVLVWRFRRYYRAYEELKQDKDNVILQD